MALKPLTCLALAGVLPAAAASAGTVTLLSQERSVAADVSSTFLSNAAGGGVQGLLAEEKSAAPGFEPFDATAALDVDAEDFLEGGLFQGVIGSARRSSPSAAHTSSFTQQGDEVAFTFTGFASSGAPGGTGRLTFEVEFLLEETTAFRLTGTGRAANDAPFFVFEDAAGNTIRNLRGFDTETSFDNPSSTFVFDGTGVDPFTDELFPATGTLDAGTYRFGFSGVGSNPGFDSGGFSLTDFGIVFADSTLAVAGGGPTPIPSPAALPAGLALLAGGLMRRRRGA